MKKVDLTIGTEKINSKDILALVIENSPHKPMGIDEMRMRVLISEALAKANGYVMLSEDEHQILSDALQTFPWSKANKTLLHIIDSVINAEEVKE